jgi:hypothetical protein
MIFKSSESHGDAIHDSLRYRSIMAVDRKPGGILITNRKNLHDWIS